MSHTVLGVDPGIRGGLAVLYPDGLTIEPMPRTADGDMDLGALSRILGYYAPEITRAYVEMATMRAGNAMQSTFKVARNFGRIEAVLHLLNIRFEIVHSTTWSAAYPHGVTEKDPAKRSKLIKRRRADIAAQLYPGISLTQNEKSTVPHDGMVDALLIADYGRMRLQPHRERTPV
jgi:hypothetical protein